MIEVRELSARYLLSEIVDDGSPELGDVLDFWGNLIDELGLENSLFFDNEEAKNIFALKFEAFKIDIDNYILEFKEKYNFFKHKMTKNWESNLKRAAYHAFFLHFGAKRRGEDDEYTGEKLDFVYHVVKASFDCLANIDHWYDEKTLIAELQHDTREDFHKGFLAMLMAKSDQELDDMFVNGVKGNPKLKDRAFEIITYLKEFEEVYFQTDEVSELIEVVSKDVGSDRLEVINSFVLRMMRGVEGLEVDYRLFEVGSLTQFIHKIREKIDQIVIIEDVILEKNDEVFFDLIWRALVLKTNDRRQNMETFRAGKRDPNSPVLKQIEFETRNIFLLLDTLFGNYLSEDSLKDFLYLQDSAKRGRVLEIENNVDEKTLIKEKFLEEFNERLSEKCDKELKFGEDYIIEFINPGIRWLDNYKITRKAIHQPDMYSKRFRSFVLFTASGEDKNISKFATVLFKEMFSGALNGGQSKRRELKSNLGQRVLENLPGKSAGVGVDTRKNGHGMGVWSVFDTPKDFIKYMHGDMHMGYFYDDVESIKNIKRTFLILLNVLGVRENFNKMFFSH